MTKGVNDMKYTNIEDANNRISEIEGENATLTAEITQLRKDKERLTETIKRKDADIKELRDAVTTSNVKQPEKTERIDFSKIRK